MKACCTSPFLLNQGVELAVQSSAALLLLGAEYERVQQRTDSSALPDTDAEPMEEDNAVDVPTKVVPQVLHMQAAAAALKQSCWQSNCTCGLAEPCTWPC